MQDFFYQFGLDWKLFLSQLVNFALVLIILRLFVYKPLLNILSSRRKKIEEGMQKAHEAETRLKEADEVFKKRIKEAEQKCVILLDTAEKKTEKCEIDMTANLKKREEELIKKAEVVAESRKKEVFREISREAAGLLRSAIAKAVESEPDKVDETLIKKAVSFLKKENEILF